jgi:DNA repair exonuclease SbcCD ATPase subunit
MALAWGIIDLEGDIEKIASQMGVALITTIIGMTVRIILVQFNPIVSEPEQDVMHSLGELANQMQNLSSNFNRDLSQSINHLTKYRNQLVDELEKAKTSLTENLQKTYEDTHKASLERIGSSLEGFQNTVRNLNLEISQFTEKLQEVDIDPINEASPKLGQTMTELSTGISSVNNQLANVSNALIAAVDDLGTLSNSAEQIKSAQLEFDKAVSRTIQLTESMEVANKVASDGELKVVNQLSDLDAAFKEVTKKTEGLSKAAESLQTNFEQNAMDVVKFLRDKNRQ